MVDLVLLANEGPSCDEYLSFLNRRDIEPEIAFTMRDLVNVLGRKAFNGILVDVPTLVKADPDLKEEVMAFFERFPVLRLNINPADHSVRTLYYGQSGSSDEIFSYFVDEVCSSCGGSMIRRTVRRQLHFHVALYERKTSHLETAEHAFTLNVSETGCFVVSTSQWDDHENVWLTFKEMKDDEPIKARICRCVYWGDSMKIPGLGAAFEEIKANQVDELRGFIEPESGRCSRMLHE